MQKGLSAKNSGLATEPFLLESIGEKLIFCLRFSPIRIRFTVHRPRPAYASGLARISGLAA